MQNNCVNSAAVSIHYRTTARMSDSLSTASEQPQKSLADQSKEKILFTAMELFARNGYHKTPAARIAKATGISHGLLFYHFGSKEGLLQSIVDFSVRKIEQIVSVDETEPPARQLTQLSQNFRKSLVEETNFWELYHSLLFQPDLKDEIMQQLLGAFENYRKQLVHIFEQLGYLSPSDAMLQFEAMRNGIMISYLMQGKNYPLDRLFRNLVDRFS